MPVRILVLFASLGPVAKRIEPVASADPPLVRIISDNPIYAPCERSDEAVTIEGWIR
jgi:hypothetical protein